MMHLFINALAASAGGGLTYVRNVLPYLEGQPDLRVTIALNPVFRAEFSEFNHVQFIEPHVSGLRRFWYEQFELPNVLRSGRAHVLLSAGNFALRNSPVPQVLLSRNSVYTSPHFYRDLLARHEYGAWIDTKTRGWLAKRSIRWANVTAAPSRAFADELQRWTGAGVLAIHHGFDNEAFVRDSSPLAEEVEKKLISARESLKLLFVSHYNYYRNFETLIRALPLLRKLYADRPIRLLLTCNLAPGKNPGAYRAEKAAALVKELDVSEMVVELGEVPYRQLHQLYRQADLYVTPAYCETFAHPLVEAMASGLPIVASDLPVHREICEDAATYFPPFSAEGLASAVAQVAASAQRSGHMREVGAERAHDFSWKKHVDEILQLCRSLCPEA